METVLRDVRFGLRMLLKNPGFTAVAIITMALGLGANTALFSVVNGVMLKSLPFSDVGLLSHPWRDADPGTEFYCGGRPPRRAAGNPLI